MNNPTPHPIAKFPLWPYLNQPLFHDRYQAIVNPHRFWVFYQVCYLERCFLKNYRPEERFH